MTAEQLPPYRVGVPDRIADKSKQNTVTMVKKASAPNPNAAGRKRVVAKTSTGDVTAAANKTRPAGMDFGAMKYKELQAECKRQGLSAGGKTAVLVARLASGSAAETAEIDEGVEALAETEAEAEDEGEDEGAGDGDGDGDGEDKGEEGGEHEDYFDKMLEQVLEPFEEDDAEEDRAPTPPVRVEYRFWRVVDDFQSGGQWMSGSFSAEVNEDDDKEYFLRSTKTGQKYQIHHIDNDEYHAEFVNGDEWGDEEGGPYAKIPLEDPTGYRVDFRKPLR